MTRKLTVVTHKDFYQEVIRSDKPVLVLFDASWSHRCKGIMPVLEEISEKRSEDLSIMTLDVDSDRSIALNYHVESVPSFILFKNGRSVKTRIGIIPENEIEAWIGL